MATRAQVKRLAAQHGAEFIDDSPDRVTLNVSVWTPAGTEWIAGGGHCLVGYSVGFWSEAWDDLAERMRQGTRPCSTPQCDNC